MSLQEALALRDKIQLLKELKLFLDSLDGGNDISEDWEYGHYCAVRSVVDWIIDKIIELGDTLKETDD